MSFNVDVLLDVMVSVEDVVLNEGDPLRQDVLSSGEPRWHPRATCCSPR